MKKIRVTLSEYNSPFYPVQARWKVNGVGYNAVFETKEQAQNYFRCKYLDFCEIKES